MNTVASAKYRYKMFISRSTIDQINQNLASTILASFINQRSCLILR